MAIIVRGCCWLNCQSAAAVCHTRILSRLPFFAGHSTHITSSHPCAQQLHQPQRKQQKMLHCGGLVAGSAQRIGALGKLNIKMEPQQLQQLQQQPSGTFACLPPTPPSSMSSSDDYDEQQHRRASHSNRSSPASRSPSVGRSGASSSSSSSSSGGGGGGYVGTSSRQPIHTPLISSQPVSLRRRMAIVSATMY